MDRSRVLAVALLIALAGVVGCAPERSTAPAQPTSGPGAAPAAQPAAQPAAKAPGAAPEKLIIAIAGDADTMDMMRTPASVMRQWIGRQIVESLADQEMPSGEVRPLLAEKWQQVDDLHWRVTIRKGVKFPDGKFFKSRELTAEDVAGSITWGIDPKSSFGRSFFGTVESARAIDSVTVEVTLKAPDPAFYRRLAYMSVMPKEILSEETLATHVEGSGPYRLVSWRRNQSILLERNETYWGSTPPFKQVEFLIRQEASVRANAVKVGEAHIATQLNAELIGLVPKVARVPGSEVAGYELNSAGQKEGGSIMQDKRVRQAVNQAIDRQAIVASVFGGYAALPNGQYNPPGMTGTDPTLRDYPYDPEKAKTLINQAGAQGKEVVIGSVAGRWLKAQELAQAVAAYLTAIGLKPKIETYEYAKWAELVQGHPRGASRPYDVFINYHGNEFFESAMKSFNMARSATAGGGNWLMADPQVDQLAQAAISERDPARRLELMRQTWRRIHDEALILPIAVPEFLFGVNERLQWQPRSDDSFYVSEVRWN